MFAILEYTRSLVFPKPRCSDRETDRIQSRDRQTCYPINSSMPHSNWSEIPVDRQDWIATACLQRNVNYPPAIPSVSLLQLIAFKYRYDRTFEEILLTLTNGKLLPRQSLVFILYGKINI